MQRQQPPPALAEIRPPRLPALSRALAAANGRAFEAARGDLLIAAGDPLETVHLVADGMVASLARSPGGAAAEAGIVGPGGLVGYVATFGATVATSDAVALTTVRGLAADAALLAWLAGTDRRVGQELMAYALWRIAEVERLCACAATHSVEQRLARWMFSAAAVADGRPIGITHHQLARLFAVRRASVTVSLHLLEGEQAVRCRRGLVELRDLTRLEACSCGCHRPIGLGRPRTAQDA